jgi:hypothetical protein
VAANLPAAAAKAAALPAAENDEVEEGWVQPSNLPSNRCLPGPQYRSDSTTSSSGGNNNSGSTSPILCPCD